MSAPVGGVSAREQFDRQAAHYNARWSSWSDETLRRMREMAEPQGDWRVLDVATGAGFTALAFAPDVRAVVGADISPGMLAQARRQAEEAGVENVTWTEAPAEALPFEDAAFDLVTVRIAPHHFVDVPAFLSETYRVLRPADGVRPGGALVLGDTTVPDGDAEAAEWQNAVERLRDPSHAANLSPNTWRALLEAAGFSVMASDADSGGIPIALSAWLTTAGCDADRSAQVRRMFVEAPASAQRQFQIAMDADGETHFTWQRVVLRAVRP